MKQPERNGGMKLPWRFKEARMQNKIKLIDAAKRLGVAQPTLSAWEGGRKEPSIAAIARMAEMYSVSIEYLLGYDSFEKLSSAQRIPIESLSLFHGKPVWVKDRGWALVNGIEQSFIYVDGSREAVDGNLECYFAPPAYTEPAPRTERPLTWEELPMQAYVWLEPISVDQKLRAQLRGRYRIIGRFAENAYGNRFHFDRYGADWLAFAVK